MRSTGAGRGGGGKINPNRQISIGDKQLRIKKKLLSLNDESLK